MSDETIIKVKLWGVIALLVICLGYLTVTDRQIENRVTRIEAQYESVLTTLTELKQLTRDIRQDQIRRYNREINGK